MTSPRKLAAGVTALAVLGAAGGGAAAQAAKAPPKTATIKAVSSVKYKINRYLELKLRWKRDNYSVKHGGTLRIVNLAPNDGPHSWTVVKKKDLPRTKKQLNNCKICEELGAAHGADPNSDQPPKWRYLENGNGQNDPPNVDRPGDSALLGPNKGDVTKLHVTAKRGKTLHFMCLIHPWMQAKLHVR